MDNFKTPAWVHHAIFYQIFPDRFAISKKLVKPNNLESWDSAPSGHGYKGGDLLGVVEKLDYLQDLGVNALYLNPVFQSASNHRYHTHDYFQVDPMLGGNKALKKLLKEAHRRNMRVVLDGVFNHASRGFFQFNDILENGEKSAYLDWFDIHGFPLNAYQSKPNYRCWWNLPALPEFNTDNLQVREFIFSVGKYWVDQGIDGWRLDVPYEIDDDVFWQEFRRVVKQANPEVYITGEIAADATRWLKGDQFDAVMNYLLTYGIWFFFGAEDVNQDLFGNWIRSHAPDLKIENVQDFAGYVQALLEKYPREAVLAQMNLLDSHDTARFLSIVNGRKDLLLLAVLFLMTYPGAPSIYYGDEIGLDGGNDPDCRKAFPWDISRWDSQMLGFYQRCISMRKAYPVLRDGDFKVLYALDQVMVYLRSSNKGDEQLLVAINRSNETRHVDVDLKGLVMDGSALQHVLANGEMVMQGGYVRDLVIAPVSGVVLKLLST
jgi:neopullulanase